MTRADPLTTPGRAGGPVVPARGGASRWAAAAAGLFCVASGVAAAGLFLPHQNFWLDEATQMAGLTLDPVEQVRWLAGWSAHDFGLLDDRMPPLSYWVGWLWWRAVGYGEAQLRWLGVCLVGAASLLVFLAGRRAWGVGPGLAAGLLFALSPNVVASAVEIRAYPLYLLASAGAFSCLLRYAADPPGGGRWLAGLTACLAAAMFTHFFGLVLAGAALAAALRVGPGRGAKVGPVALAAAAVGLSSLGLAPFALAAFRHSSGSASLSPADRAGALVQFGYRTFTHPCLAVHPAALGLAAVGAALAGGAALAPRRTSAPAASALLTALAAGAAVVVPATFVLKRFNAASASYNFWTAPALALLAGSGLAAASRPARRASLAGVVMLTAAYADGDAQLAVHGEAFAHCAHHAIDALIRGLGPPGRVVVILDGDEASEGQVYFPLRFEYAGALRQYAARGDGRGGFRLTDFPAGRADVDLGGLSASADYLVVVRSANERTFEVVRQIREGVRPLGDGPAARSLKSDPRWSLAGEMSRVSFVGVDVDLFRRARGPAPEASTDDRPARP